MNAFMHGFLDEMEKIGGKRWEAFKRGAKREGPALGVGLMSGLGVGALAGVSRGKTLGRREAEDKKKKKSKK